MCICNRCSDAKKKSNFTLQYFCVASCAAIFIYISHSSVMQTAPGVCSQNNIRFSRELKRLN